MVEKMNELTEQELSQTAGGLRGKGFLNKEVFYNSKDEPIGYRIGNSNPIQYVPCDKCHKPMHMGSFGWYCDPCNRHLYFVSSYDWAGTKEELIAAAG